MPAASAPSRPHQVLAAIRNAALTLLRRWNHTNIAVALRENAYQPARPFTKLGILNKGEALQGPSHLLLPALLGVIIDG